MGPEASVAADNVLCYLAQHMTKKRNSVRAWVESLPASGRHSFTTSEAVRVLGGSLPAVRAALRRVAATGWIVSPYRGFHLVVPPEYRRLGCLPADQLVPLLMEHLGEPYYAGLLSAAEYYGAAHQRPQAFQVMLRKSRRPLACGRVRVRFHRRSDLQAMPVREFNTPRGVIRVATPEVTALELVGYARACGGLENVATVLQELTEAIDPARLAEVAARCPMAWIQRCGWLLEKVGAGDAARGLAAVVRAASPPWIRLVREKRAAGSEFDRKWRIIVNDSIEVDQ